MKKTPLHAVMNESLEKTSWECASDGTYLDKVIPRIVSAIFLTVAFACILIPSVGMVWAKTDITTENRELTVFPTLYVEDGSLNLNILSDLGAYFQDHFAYRNEMVTANAKIRSALETSPTDQVVVGEGDWLYYGGTLPDYLGQGQLTERGLANVAHNLSLAQNYVEGQGAKFVFAIAPNKNSLYDENMPYYYLPYEEDGNAERLKPYLEQMGVNYVDLFDLFRYSEDIRYLMRDSHWDNLGALSASNAIRESIGDNPFDIDPASAVARKDFSGDLESMLNPADIELEENQYFEGINDEEGFRGCTWKYVEGSDVTDDWVVTSSDKGQGSLLMFRDSFGNAMLPFWASTYKTAAFSKLVPYNLPTMVQLDADTVVVERTERHLAFLAENAPIAYSPEVKMNIELPKELSDNREEATIKAALEGSYLILDGSINESAADPDMKIIIAIEDESGVQKEYEPYWISIADESGKIVQDYGYKAMLNPEKVNLNAATIRVYGIENGIARCLQVEKGHSL